MNSRNLNQAAVAGLAGVTPAAVVKWFCQAQNSGWINMETNTLRQLAKSLGVEAGVLLSEPVDLSSFSTRFLWDRAYPDMSSFMEALKQSRPQALARFVQVMGWGRSLRILGRPVLRLFPRYKKFIKPQRRKQLETLWPLYSSPT